MREVQFILAQMATKSHRAAKMSKYLDGILEPTGSKPRPKFETKADPKPAVQKSSAYNLRKNSVAVERLKSVEDSNSVNNIQKSSTKNKQAVIEKQSYNLRRKGLPQNERDVEEKHTVADSLPAKKLKQTTIGIAYNLRRKIK